MLLPFYVKKSLLSFVVCFFLLFLYPFGAFVSRRKSLPPNLSRAANVAPQMSGAANVAPQMSGNR
jgi:hypothetical protein